MYEYYHTIDDCVSISDHYLDISYGIAHKRLKASKCDARFASEHYF